MGSKHLAPWTEERTARFRKLHAQRLSFAKIAADLGGTTREACAGKAMRMGLSGTQNKGGFASAVRSETFKASPPTQAAVPSMPNGSDIPIAQRCTLLQLTSSVCRWPFGEPSSPDFFFCGGGAVEGKPYCAGHCRMAYRDRAA
jgi:GcrA cell cycle regulator